MGAPRAAAPDAPIRPARVADAPAIARVHVGSWRSAYRGIVPDDYLDGLSLQESEETWTRLLERHGDGVRVFVAEEDGGAVVGFAVGGPGRARDPVDPAYQGELWGIHIDEAHRARGLGRALTREVVRWLASQGMRSMFVWCLCDAPARRFYEALGGARLRTTRVEIGGALLDYAAFGWLDTGPLA